MTVINKNDSKKAVKNTSLDKGWVAPSLVLLVSPTVQTSVLPEVSKTTTFIGHLYCTFCVHYFNFACNHDDDIDYFVHA